MTWKLNADMLQMTVFKDYRKWHMNNVFNVRTPSKNLFVRLAVLTVAIPFSTDRKPIQLGSVGYRKAVRRFVGLVLYDSMTSLGITGSTGEKDRLPAVGISILNLGSE